MRYKVKRKGEARRWLVMPSVIVGVAVLWLVLPGLAHQKDFAAWLETLRVEARQRGIHEKTLDAALTGLRPLPRVIELDRRQLEFTLTLSEYLQRVLPPALVQRF